MKLSGDAVVLRSADEWYELERIGEKPTTVRLMTADEWAALFEAGPTLIVIRHVDSDREFTRQIRSIHNVTGVLERSGITLGDRVLVEICWNHVVTVEIRTRVPGVGDVLSELNGQCRRLAQGR